MKRILVNNFCFIALCILVLTGCEKKFGEGVSLKDIEVEPALRVMIDQVTIKARAKAYPVPWDCTDYVFTWTSDNPAIAEVDDWGRITPNDLGTCTITVRSGSISKTISVEIYDPPIKDRLSALGVKYLWDFEDAGNLFKPSIGNRNLEPIGSGFEQVEGNNSAKKAIHIPTSVRNESGEWVNHFYLNHGFAANGGGSLVNQFTIMLDIFIPNNGGDRAIFNTKYYPASKIAFMDAGCYYRNDGRWGINGSESAGNMVLKDQWYRIVMCVDFGVSIKYWIDGTPYLPNNGANGSIDWDQRAWPLDGIVLFTDAANRNNVNEVTVAALAIWDRYLLDSEVSTIGTLRK